MVRMSIIIGFSTKHCINCLSVMPRTVSARASPWSSDLTESVTCSWRRGPHSRHRPDYGTQTTSLVDCLLTLLSTTILLGCIGVLSRRIQAVFLDMSILLENDRLENRMVDVKESQNTGTFATPWSMSRAAKMMTSDRVNQVCPLHWAAGPRLGNPGIFTPPGAKLTHSIGLHLSPWPWPSLSYKYAYRLHDAVRLGCVHAGSEM